MTRDDRRQVRQLLERCLEETLAEYPPLVRSAEIQDVATGEVMFRLLRLYVPGGTVVDLGGGVSCTLPALRRAGMRVIVVDDYERPYYALAEYRAAIELLAASGVEVRHEDLLRCGLDFVGDGTVDRVGCFNCLEHLHHSPRSTFETAVRRLRPGGLLLVGVPNAVNLMKRIRVLCGRTNLGTADEFYHRGSPFTGHVREWTASELVRLSSWLGLEAARVVGRNWFLRSSSPRLPAPLRRMLDGALRPFPGLCSNLHLEAAKPAAGAARRQRSGRISGPGGRAPAPRPRAG